MTKTTRRLVRYLLLPVAVVSMVFVSPVAMAIPDITFYAGNDITHYDPDSCATGAGDGSSAEVVEGDNLKTILLYYTKTRGLSLAQAAGIAGNMKQESGFDPTIIQGGAKAPDNYVLVPDVGFGLIQWTSPGRQKNLMAYAKETDRKITDITMQLDFAWKEMTGSYKHTIEALKKATDPVEAAIIVHGPPNPGFEASNDSQADVRKVRGGNAKRYYDQFKGEIADGAGSTASGDATSEGGGGCGGGDSSEFSADGFIIYDQCDTRWAGVAYGRTGKTACTSGCGPTAMAMAITALTKKSVTPKETVAYASEKGMYVDGVGSSWVLPQVIGDKFGVNTKKIDMTVGSINETLKAGGLVILSGSNSAPFTSAGHYILIRGVTEGGKWKIGDSNGETGKKNSQKEWNPRDILVNANGGSTYAVTK